jgi:hypothetical protein
MSDPSLTAAQLTELSNIYLVANTPAYLFKRLRATQIVQTLAQKHTATELLTYARNSSVSYRMSADQMARAYAALVAATLRPFDETRRIGEQEWPRMRWGQDIRSIAQSSPSNNASVARAVMSPTITAKTVPSGPTGGRLIIP